ncbi:MAG: type II toxin-antitoxin system CcdA family antitoxin [Nannocystaceae bacterium]|nr:type II toxin-antitoxin system CcdA family antitoxin [bacterium]
MPGQKDRKVPTNLSLRSELVRRAKALGLNISEAVDAALEDVIRSAEREAWLKENQEAIAEYNEVVERRGVFSDDWRTF